MIGKEEREKRAASNFIEAIVQRDLAEGTYGTRVATRFPPEPNGYLHIGHAKSICLNFGLARDYDGQCHLRFDDTNPTTEDVEYVESIKNDVRWLGFDWGENLFFASDYFEQLYLLAEGLIKKGLAYVDSQSLEEIRKNRGTVTEAGVNSPYRERGVEENLDLFRRMRAGEFEDGSHVLRAKIDMAAANMQLRDPLLYRIKHAHHYRTGDEWCIYPMYDYAHPLSDAIEGITHSICTLEFENNRPLYDWVVENAWDKAVPHQYEFARLNVDYTVMSKRKLLRLVEEGHVDGWDDPRLPTIAGMRRRGITPAALRNFCDEIGVAKANSRVDVALLEYSIRDDLNLQAPRVMAVLDPLPVTITNYPEGDVEWLEAPFYPQDVPKEGSRKVPFGKHLLIERSDFMIDPPKKYHRLSPGAEVRLRYGYFITCTDIVRDPDSGAVTEVLCTYDPQTKGGDSPDGRRVRGTIHWVSASHSLPAEVRLYDRLFTSPNPEDSEADFIERLNPESLVTVLDARVEPSVADDAIDTRYQFERQGYFWRDPVDSTDRALVFNRIVTLKDAWAKKVKAPAEKQKRDDRTQPVEHVHRLPTLTDEQSKRAREYQNQFDLTEKNAAQLAARDDLSLLFDEAVANSADPRRTVRVLLNNLAKVGHIPFGGKELASLVGLLATGKISSGIGKQLLDHMVKEGGDPERLLAEKNLQQVSDVDELKTIVDKILADNPAEVASFKGGKSGLMGFFVGAVMRATQGKANPEVARRVLAELLGA